MKREKWQRDNECCVTSIYIDKKLLEWIKRLVTEGQFSSISEAVTEMVRTIKELKILIKTPNLFAVNRFYAKGDSSLKEGC